MYVDMICGNKNKYKLNNRINSDNNFFYNGLAYFQFMDAHKTERKNKKLCTFAKKPPR